MKETMRISTFATTLVIFLVFVSSVWSQDQHFTQFYASPLTLNPALTGAFTGGYRFGFSYRDQGRSNVDVPFTTTSAAIDVRFGLNSSQKVRRDKVGVGMLFFNDRSASVNFFTNYIALSGAFHKALSKNDDQFLSVGFQTGIAQRNVNYDNFSFEDQFNGSNGYSDPTAEILPENNFSYGDFAAGIHYSYAPRQDFGIFMGAGIHHFLEPQVSFYSQSQPAGDSRLFTKYTAHLGLRFPLNNRLQLFPRALYYQQGPHTAVNSGTNLRILLEDSKGTALHLGSWARLTTNANIGMTWDAAVIMAGLEYNNFLVGFSYDAKIVSFTAGGNPGGGFEISITYLGNHEDTGILCPSF